MDRSQAATTLFLWQFEGQADLVRAAGGNGDRSLPSLVEAAGSTRAWASRSSRPSAPSVAFVQLDEERALTALRTRVRELATFLRPEEREHFERQLREDLMPGARLAALVAELDRVGSREVRQTVQAEFENGFLGSPARPGTAVPAPATPKPATLRAVLLFARDGRLLAGEGGTDTMDLPALSALVARGEPGSTWSLAHREGVLVGHVGERAGLVAVFGSRPKVTVGGALRVALRSLEERDRLVNALTHPGSHTTLTAYVRAVRSLLTRNA